MANTFFGLTIGASGLSASNAAINTAAHNISNVNTKGYSKQVANQSASASLRVYSTYGCVGTGVNVTSIDQLRSSYYDTKYWNNNANYGKYSTLENYSTLLEDYLDEFNLEGFTTEYENFFATINTMLTTDPTSEVSRNQFVNYAKSITEYFNTLSTNLSSVQKSANDEIQSTVDSINTIAEQIASLNKQINTIEVNGGSANDLRDARANLVDQLSQHINTTVKEIEVGNNVTEFYVYVDNQQLVDSYDYNTIICTAREDKRNASDLEGLFELSWSTGMEFNMYSTSLSGGLKGAIDMRDGCNECYEVVGLRGADGEFIRGELNRDGKFVEDNTKPIADIQDIAKDEDAYNAYMSAGYEKVLTTYTDSYRNSDYKGVPYYQSQINTFVQVFTNEINAVISKGDMGGEAVLPFFTSNYGSDYMSALNVTVNPEILNDISKLPYSFDNTQGAANVDMATELFALKNKITINNGTFMEYLSSIVSVISIDTSRTRTFSQNYSNIEATIKNQRLSISGVDEDEEAVDLVKYQKAYDLSSKVISVMQQIYNKLINETGV